MKYVFYFLIALGAALYFPESRAVVTGFAEPAITPVLRWGTTNEMERIVGDLETEAETRSWLPEREEEFQNWLRRSYQGEESWMDSWGGGYTLEVRRGTFRLVSAGPDEERGTEDDITVSGQDRR